ncbi:MAG: tyrosine-type recombinase/integrase [Parcubacteria group bacterium]
MSIDKLIVDFLHELEITKKRSWRTVRNYDLYLRRFAGWLIENKITEPKHIDVVLLRAYHEWLMHYRSPIKKSGLKRNTQNYHLIALRAFFRFLAKKGVKSASGADVRLVLLPKTVPVMLSKDELGKLLEAPLKKVQSAVIQFRDKALLELLNATGLRVSDIAELKRRDIDLKNIKIRLNNRNITFSQQAGYWLAKYINERTDKSDYLFVGHDKTQGERQRQSNLVGLSVRSIERTVAHYAKISKINRRVTPHVLRHTFARHLLAKGGKCDDLQRQLGHKALATTRKYL